MLDNCLNINNKNLFKMNHWDVRSFIIVVLAIQFATWGLIGIDAIGFQIPILRQVICFIYLSFVPGIIILRILKLRIFDYTETLLFAVGLSLTTLMLIGFSLNIISPYLGITNPISILPLVAAVSIVILLLCLLYYITESSSIESVHDKFNIRFPPQIFCLFLLPFLSISGTYLVNLTGINKVLLFLLLTVSIIPIFVVLKKLPRNLFGLAILMISISLLFHRSLISTYLWGWDVNTEYYYSRLVVSQSFWNPTYFANVNSALSIVILSPIYSIICDVNLIWVYKIFYPLIYSLIPLGLFQISKKQTSDEIAFFAAFFFMSVFTFYQQMPELGRQEIAELYLVLIVLLFLNVEISNILKSSLLIIFSFSMIISHYGLSYIYLFYLIFTWVMLILSNKFQKLGFSFYVGDSVTGLKSKTITINYILFFIVSALSWHMYASNSSVFVDIVQIIDNIVINLSQDFLDPEVTEGLSVATMGTSSLLYTILKYLQFTTIFFIIIGIVVLIARRGYMNIQKLYTFFSVSNFGLCVLGMTLPFFAESLTVARLYHITLIFLAPFCIIGGIFFFSYLFAVFGRSKNVQKDEKSMFFLSIFFCIFLLFNSGFVHEVLKDDIPNSIALNSSLDYPRFNAKEVSGAQWLGDKIDSRLVYGDFFDEGLLHGYIAPIWRVEIFTGYLDYIDSNSFIYLRNLNINGKCMVVSERKTFERPYDYINLSTSPFFTKVLFHSNEIYDNGGSEIYHSGENAFPQ